MNFVEVFDKFLLKNIGSDVSSNCSVCCSISGSDGKSRMVDNFHDIPMALMSTFLCTSVKFSRPAGMQATSVLGQQKWA